MKGYTLKNRRYAILSAVVVLLLWGMIAGIVNNPIKIPSPKETAFAFVTIVKGEYFYIEVVNSLKRILLSFLISLSCGVILGIVSGFVTPIYYLLKPIVLTQRAMPTMGVILLSLIWLNREIAPVLVGILVIFPIIYSAVVNGVRNIDKKLIEMVEIYHFSKKRKLIYLYLPSIRSSLMSVSAAVISLNIKIIIAAEVLSQPKHAIGTGFQIEKVALNTAGVLAWSIVAIILAGFFEWLIETLFTKVLEKKSLLERQ